jgi:hypothetical protein
VGGVDRVEVVMDARHAVAGDHGDEDLCARSGCEQRGDARQRGVVVAEHAAQERAPREVDRHRVGAAVEGLWRVLGRGDREQRVRHRVALRGAPGGLDHARRVGIEADRQGVGTRPRGGQHMAAVTGPEVDREAVVARRQRVESADVDVVEAAASEHTDHASSLSDMDAFPTRGPKNPSPALPSIAGHRQT